MSEPKQQSVMDQLGGVSGLVYTSLPILIFVPVNSIWNLTAAIWAAVGVAVLIAAWRVFRKESIQPAISGVLGVAVSAFIAHRTGDAKGYFLFGIYTSLAYGAAFVVSILIRWPLVGIIWGFLNGHGNLWRRHKGAVRAYDIATAAWALVFGARYVVQSQLYDTDHTGWLAVARIAMGWPLAGLAFVVTIWAVRKADRIVEPPPTESDIEAVGEEPGDQPDQRDVS
ncbi:DUF3159 domain-containing protein [Rhodococcus sp. AD45-ID]|uniref:DUF3159 domain-containing protein n=1 Tax=Rhodococcus globerulus TaxID=33008 RepID=A0ABU4BMQ9_RHOGO|nr:MULTISPECIES: DUF3159 domain-containing protein [Rhodococcus]NRI64165.1 DUF3159 domain-containing protein [Rhodococcus sp. MS16]MDV6265443.1 DUF3159 domain-containing protein [Rhodococcus globerulus]MDV8070166.1 DUF3159 domain-containing protein [Rhodococcus sp. IEGM 1366]PSR40025.1 DUF3159 domain-containing protein [Rhodococcus sp. AD45-ID]QXW02855.1 DUF3159 domain-containing protein [Rhodococcus globerulus]